VPGPMKRIAINTGGGDAPGLNAVIYSGLRKLGVLLAANLRSRGRLPRLQKDDRKRGALPAGPTGRGGPQPTCVRARRDAMALPNPPRGLSVHSRSTPILHNGQYAAVYAARLTHVPTDGNAVVTARTLDISLGD
jgi:hypothetical protein